MYMFREREKIIDLFDMVCGQRLTYNYMRIGGVSQDIPEEFLPALDKLVKRLKHFLKEYELLLKQNEVLLARAKGVGVLSKELAVNCGISGPVARASGIIWDLRKADPYSIYDRFEFDIPTAENGDCYDRYRVRIEEMWQSLRIIEQASKQIPGGPVKAKTPHIIRPPAGEVYAHIEAPKGELGFYLVSDNSIAPYRCHVRPTSLINLAALRQMVKGWKVADLILIFGSIDITMGEVDR
jgi:NADH-quinone oxidoreductase subunit D